MDYRLEKNRKKAFIEWYAWSLQNKDCDPPIWMLNYLFDRFEHNIEQKLWIAWIYGTTYHLPTAWIIWNEFPDYELVDYDRLKFWNDMNYKRLRYQTDTKYNKGYLPEQFKSYKNWIKHNNPTGLQKDKFKKFVNFEHLWTAITKNLYKFGRYSTWFYMQTLNQCVNLNFKPNNLMLKDHSGSRSHRNGLCYAVGKDEWIDKKLSEQHIDYLNYEAQEIENYIQNILNIKTDYYNLETCLCSFKKIFRTKNGRYLGYYLDRQAEEIKSVEKDNWSGIDWDVFWQGREEKLHKDLYTSKEIDKSLYPVFMETGNFMREICLV